MKVGVISDLHVDTNERPGRPGVIEALAKVAKDKQLDRLLIAGDISSDFQITLQALEQFQAQSEIPYLFVPGNHDVWNVNHPQQNAWEIYRALQKDPNNLCDRPVQLNDEWVVIGDLGWYDFSFGSSEFDQSDFERMNFEGRTWQDSLYADWQQSTLSVHQHFYNKIYEQLQQYRDYKRIVLTHVVSHAAFTVPLPHPMWRYFNAFLGSEQYGQLLVEQGVEIAVCGHVHYRKTRKVSETEWICSCLGYRREWHYDDILKEIDHALSVIQL